MTYQVLARKYRPRSFAQLVGQASTCRILKNSLEHGRIHHAYLFSGTRGVGKTSLARLFAKCLNCQQSLSSEPCDRCACCEAINSHCFTDLIEVDAASRTKVEDTRDLLADVHYAPTQGRYKVYLIDEVHMLSSHSFNALLKTLEEPPPHVVFLLATTDPQKLPATILSRCLQFHLKALSPLQICQHLALILKNEGINYDEAALEKLAHASRGSIRDSLSLLDQTIAYAPQNITIRDVESLLGCIAQDITTQLLEAIHIKDTVKIWSIVEKINDQATDYAQVITALLSLLYDIALLQILPQEAKSEERSTAHQQLAQQFSAEEIQLYYQIGLLSQRDLVYAPTPRIGFEMMLLRMLAFQPIDLKHEKAPSPLAPKASANSIKAPVPNQPDTFSVTETNEVPDNKNLQEWLTLIKKLALTGITHTFACQCVLHSRKDSEIILHLDPKHTAFHTPKQESKLAQALSNLFGYPVTLSVQLGKEGLVTPAHLERQQQTQRVQNATQTLQKDATLQQIIKTFDAKIKPESLEFLQEQNT